MTTQKCFNNLKQTNKQNTVFKIYAQKSQIDWSEWDLGKHLIIPQMSLLGKQDWEFLDYR